MIGRTFGQYEIVDRLGAGGMGEVYRARDLRLNRDVAIKVLPAAVATDPERLARMEREAQLLAQLEHAHVAAVYGLEEAPAEAGGDAAQGTLRFLVMQLAEGQTLEALLQGGPLPLDEALPIAEQIADGLEAAHERGIVHRDLKPANIMVGSDGQVKILDFGLAKALGPEAATGISGRDLSASPTMMAATGVGVIMGTAAYMSPEQARGRPVDRRCDVWAFGCVLFEMLTGSKAFDGDTVTDVMAAIVTRDPDWDQIPETTPASVRQLLLRCMDKDPRQRLRDVGEARVLLQRGDSGSGLLAGDAPTAAGAVDRRGWIAAAVMAVVAAAALVVAWGLPGAVPPEAAPRFVTLAEPGLAPVAGARRMAVSPDGESIAFVARRGGSTGIWIRRLDEPGAHEVPGTANARTVFWSPDGQSLGFVQGADLRALDLRSGALVTRYPTEGTLDLAAWISQDRARELAARFSDAQAQMLGSGPELVVGRFLSEHGHTDTLLLDAEDAVTATLFEGPVAAIVVPPDLLLTWREGSLWAQRLDLENREVLGSPVALLLDVDITPGDVPLVSIGGDTLAYRAGGSMTGQTTMDLVDRSGQLIERLGETANYYSPRISPDEERIAYDLSDETNAGNIWVRENDGVTNRITSSERDETRPVWSPDGSRLAIRANSDDGRQTLSIMRWDAPGSATIEPSTDAACLTDWADGIIVAHACATAADLRGIWIVAEDGSGATLYRDSAFDEYGGEVSPDGHWLAYTSTESGAPEVWIESFPEPGRRRRVSAAGGEMPAWRADGRELFYIDREDRMVAVPIPADAPLSFGAGTVLFDAPVRVHQMRQYDVYADGQRFLLNRRVESADEPIRLLINWRQELARRAGSDW